MEAVLSKLPPAVLLVAYAVFWAWEGISAARANVPMPGRRWQNLCISAVSIFISAAAGFGLIAISAFVASRHWGFLGIISGPIWFGVAIGLVALDVVDYWRHRLSHRLGLLWRLHRVHHSDVAMDVTTSFRNHPIEMVIRPLFFMAAIPIFGVPPLSLVLQPLLQLPILVFQHANVRLPERLDRALALLLVTPGMHTVHHSRQKNQTDSNYSTWLSIWDRLFGSFTPFPIAVRIGLDGFDDPRAQTISGILATPWRPL